MRQILQMIFENLNLVTMVISYVYLMVFITSRGRAVLVQGILSFVIVVAILYDPLCDIHYTGYARYVYLVIWTFLTIWNIRKV